MDGVVDVTIPVDRDAAEALENPVRREAAGRVLSDLLKRDALRAALAEAIADAKREARANGLTDADIDAELEAWRRATARLQAGAAYPSRFGISSVSKNTPAMIGPAGS